MNIILIKSEIKFEIKVVLLNETNYNCEEFIMRFWFTELQLEANQWIELRQKVLIEIRQMTLCYQSDSHRQKVHFRNKSKCAVVIASNTLDEYRARWRRVCQLNYWTSIAFRIQNNSKKEHWVWRFYVWNMKECISYDYRLHTLIFGSRLIRILIKHI